MHVPSRAASPSRRSPATPSIPARTGPGLLFGPALAWGIHAGRRRWWAPRSLPRRRCYVGGSSARRNRLRAQVLLDADPVGLPQPASDLVVQVPGSARGTGASPFASPASGRSGRGAHRGHGGQVRRHRPPRPAAVGRAEHLARRGTEVQAERIAAVVPEGLAKDREIGLFLWQPLASRRPGGAR